MRMNLWKRLGAVLSAIGICMSCLAGCGQAESGTMTIDILKIGKADCSIITDGEHTILIDCGEADDSTEILDTLDNMQIEKVDALILTHYDKDHIGGAAGIILNCEIGELIEPDYIPENPESEAYVAYREAVSQTGLPVVSVTERLELEMGDILLSMIGAGEHTYTQNIDNNCSLVVELEHLGNRFLFAGDIEKQRISEMLEEGMDSYDFLKVPHHGIYDQTLVSLFSAVNMDYAVITCSKKNPADPETLEALSETGCQVHCTADGNIRVISTEEGIKVVQ